MTQFNEPRFGVDDAPISTRTSVMAIFSLVCGLLSLVGCCLLGIAPGVGFIGGLLGGLALFRISNSNGRLGGSGLAIGGIITSILGLALGILIVVGATRGLNEFETYGKAMTIAQSPDQSGLNNYLTTQAANNATVEGMAEFREKTLATLGKYKNVRPGLLEFFRNMGTVEQGQRSLPGASSNKPELPLPVPVQFENGPASMFVVLEQNNPSGPTPTTPFGKLENIGVYDPASGKVFWLIDPATTTPTTPTTPSTTPANTTPPATPTNPAAPAPKDEPVTPAEPAPK